MIILVEINIIWCQKTTKTDDAVVHTLSATQNITSFANLPNGFLASTSIDGLIQIWNVEEGILEKTLKGPTGSNKLAVLPSGLMASAGFDGTVKIWNAFNLNLEKTIEVTDGVWVTCTQYMTLSKRLIAASANRMISFYDLETANYNVPVSRIEGLVGIPLCMEYYRWPKNNEQKFETLLVGDDLGICNMYTFTSQNWHICQYKLGSRDPNRCHAKEIEEDFTDKVSKEFES